jgi:hypothetical protein
MKLKPEVLTENTVGKKTAEPKHQPEPIEPQSAFAASNQGGDTVKTAISAPVLDEVATDAGGKISKIKENADDEKRLQSAQPQAEPAKATILAEKISPAGLHPINETLAQQNVGSNLSSRLQTAPLSSIAAGIGLNDKFLFIRELFKGDNVLYDSAIRHLDAAESLNAAMDSIRKQFNWDEKNVTVQKFINLLHRRHGGA